MYRLCKAKLIVTSLFVLCIAATYAQQVKVITKDAHEVTLASDVINLIPTLNDLTAELEPGQTVPLSDITLVTLNAIVNGLDLLTKNARKNLAHDYVFTDAEQILTPLWQNLSIGQKADVLRAANYLGVEPLLNVYAYLMARDLSQLEGEVTSKEQFVELAKDMSNRDLVNLLAELGPGQLVQDIYRYITKHLFLVHRNIKELTVADYLFHNVCPVTDGTLDLRNKYITSLRGITCVPKPETITTIDVAQNPLFDSVLDTYPLFKPFSIFNNLVKLDISHTTGRLQTLGSLVMDIPSLKQLYSIHGQLTSLELNTLHGLSNLERLDISYNRIAILTPGYFSSLPHVQYLSVRDNLLPAYSVQDFKTIYGVASPTRCIL